MGSTGQIAGAGAGAILGAVVLAPLTAGASLAALTTEQIIGGAFLGLGIGGSLGGLIDPPRISGPRGQHEILQVQFNTFAQDLPVAISFGRVRVTGNIIFIGDTSGRVEVLGQQTVGSGKSAQTQEVEAVVYYADFVVGLVEGPITKVYSVFRDDQDISDQEGNLFSILEGDGDEGIPDIVTNAKYAVARPVPWRSLAKIVWSGRIGEANQLPRITAEIESPSTLYRRTGVPSVTLPADLHQFIYDDISGYIVAKTGDYTCSAFKRDGSVLRTTTIPTVHGKIDRVFYDGRTDVLLVFCESRVSDRVILKGLLGYDDQSPWQILADGSDAMLMGIEAYVIDESLSAVWTVHRTGSQIVFVKTSFKTGIGQSFIIQLDVVANVNVRAVHYDKPSQYFYLLYTREGTLYLRRFQFDDNKIVAGSVEEMTPTYGYSEPIGVCLIGELITIYDKGVAQPIHQFEWGRTTDRFTRGTVSSVPVFNPNYVDGLTLWLDASAMLGSYTDGQAVPIWTDRSGFVYNAQQGTASKQPVLRLNQIAGRPVIRFDGVNDFYDISGPSFDRQNVTIFIVMRGTTVASSSRTLLGMTDGASTVRYCGVGGATNLNGKIWTAEDDDPILDTQYLPNESVFLTYMGTAAGIRGWKNGNFFGFGNHTNPGTADTSIRIGNHYSGSVYFQGDVAEIIIYNRQLSEAERTEVELYLRYRYKIQFDPSNKAYQYIGIGSRFSFSNARQFYYCDKLRVMMLLDSTNNGWYVYWFQWDGSNWSYVSRYAYQNTYFEELSSAAGAVYVILTDIARGIQLPSWYVYLDYLERFSGRCNIPTNNAYYVSDVPVYSAQLQVDYLLTVKRNSIDSLREILTCVNGFFVTIDGKLAVVADMDDGIVEGSYDEDNIIEGSFTHAEVAREDRYNELVVRIQDRGNDWKPVPVPFRADYEIDLYGELRSKGIDAPAINRPRQASYIAQTAVLASLLRQHVCTFKTGPMGMRQTVTDIIEVTHSLTGWVKKKMIIVSMVEMPDDSIQFECIEYIPAVHTANGFALQDPQRLQNVSDVESSSYATVKKGARIRVIEDTVTTQVWLFVSQPDNPGPWQNIRWLVRWDTTYTPNATSYPGGAPFQSSNYFNLVTSSHFASSGLLIADITAGAQSFQIGAIMGTPPEVNFQAIIYNPEITSAQFANTHGNGKYERILCDFFVTATNTVQVTNIPGPTTGRGYHTTAVAHSRVQVTVEAHFNRNPPPGENGLVTTPEVSYWHQLALTNAAQPLSSATSEWYIGFKVSEFTSGSGGVNYIDVVIDGLASLATSPSADLRPRYYYSTGNNGEWKELTGIRDETNGFRQSGKIAFDIPSDWGTNTQWSQGYDFPTPNGSSATNVARYYIKIVVGNANGVAFQRSIQLTGQSNYTAKGFRAPIVYFILPNAQPIYDFGTNEQGYGLEFTPQPVGPHGQSIEIANLNHVSYQFKNLAAG